MKNHIAEDLPARKFAPAAAGSAPAPVGKDNKKDNSGKTPEERATQAVYDIRYKARKDEISLLNAYTEYMKSSSMSGEERNMVKAKLFRKVSGGMRAEDFNPIFKNAASDNVAKALFKVFVEKKEINIEDLKEFYTRRNSRGEVVFHVRITDRKTGKSYTDEVTREKLDRLRANPNILSVEMTDYRSSSESQRTSNTNTAGKGLDYDGDRKVESPAKEYRGVVHNAIQRRTGGVADGKDTSSVREDFIHEAGAKKKRFDVRTDIQNTVNMSPTQGGNERVGMVAHNELEGELIAENGYSKFLKKVKEEMDCGSDDKKKKNGVDNRSLATKINIAKNIVRASTGIKNPMVMVASEQTGPALPGEKRPGSPKAPGNRPHLPGEKPTPSPKLQMASYEPEGEVIDERRRQEKGTPRKPRDKAFELVAKSMGSNRLGVQPRGERKDRTGRVAPEPPQIAPADKVAKNRASRKSGDEFMRDTRGT
jgi:hypothetical protein